MRRAHYRPGDRVEILYGVYAGRLATVIDDLLNEQHALVSIKDSGNRRTWILRHTLQHADAVTALGRLVT